MRSFLLALIIFPCLAFATAYDVQVSWRNAANTLTTITLPDPGDNKIIYFNNTTNQPSYLEIGDGLKFLNNGIHADVEWSEVSNKPSWATSFDGSFQTITGSPPPVFYGDILNKPSTFIPSQHFHAIGEISGITTGGMDIITMPSYEWLRGFLQLDSWAWMQDFTTAGSAAAVAISGDYGDLSNKPTIPAAQVNSDWLSSSGASQILNKPTIPTLTSQLTNNSGYATDSYVDSQVATKFTTPAGSTSQYIRGDGSLATLPTTPSRSFSHQTRALNTCFQPSSTRDAMVSYSVDILVTLSLTAGQQGTVYLRTYTNSSCTNGAQEVVRFVNGNIGALTIGLNLSQNVTGTLSGIIPAGLWVQLVTENNTGSPTFTARPGQEVLM